MQRESTVRTINSKYTVNTLVERLTIKDTTKFEMLDLTEEKHKAIRVWTLNNNCRNKGGKLCNSYKSGQ